MKYQNNSYILNLLIEQWKVVYQHLKDFIKKQMHNKYFLNNVGSIQSECCNNSYIFT